MMDHIVNEDYLVKQKLMESVLREEQEEEGVEEPWYIKVDDEADSSVPVFRPQGWFGWVVYFVSSHSFKNHTQSLNI